jgi:hypothetical protein
VRKNEVGLQREKFLRELLHRLRVERRSAKVDPDVAPLCPPELLETLQERGDEALSFRSPSAYAISTPIRLTSLADAIGAAKTITAGGTAADLAMKQRF